MQEKIRTKPLKFQDSRSEKQQAAANGVRERRASRISSRYVHGSFPFRAGSELCAKRSFRGPSAARQPGTHEHRPLEYGFRARRCAAPRNDAGLLLTVVTGGILGTPMLLGEIAEERETAARYQQMEDENNAAAHAYFAKLTDANPLRDWIGDTDRSLVRV
jgi:hypothetical protein